MADTTTERPARDRRLSRRSRTDVIVRSHLINLAGKPAGLTGGGAIDGLSRRVDPPRRAGLVARLRGAYEHVVFYGLLLIFGLSSLVWSMLAGILYWLLPRRVGEPLGQFVIMAVFRGFVAVMRASGIIACELDELDRLGTAAPLVIAPNHPSLLDAMLVISRVPRVVCVAKVAIWDNWFLGGSARLAGFIRNDSATKLVRGAVRQVRSGRHFLIFPEGTRTNARPVGEFKGGFALIAKQAGVPVQTVFIETPSRFLGKGWPLFKQPEFPLVYRVRLGRRVEVDGDVHDVVAGLRGYYQRELGEKSPHDRGA
jgi:1-acyl-sn-glycerol-3-phosphate acyltransferase